MNGLNRGNNFYPPARRARGAMGWNQIQQKAHRDARRPKKSQQPRIAVTNKNRVSAVSKECTHSNHRSSGFNLQKIQYVD